MPQTGLMPDRYLTKKELAAMLKVETRTIDNWMREKGLPHIKIGRTVRFILADIEKWLAERRINPRG